MTITRKIKIGKIWNLVFLFIQPIAVLSYKFDHFWRIFFFRFWCLKKKNWNQKKIFFLQKWSNLHERSGIGWIERKTKFQIFPIFIYRVMKKKHNVAGNSGLPLSANLLKLESWILTRAKRATNRNNVATEKRSNFFSGGFYPGTLWYIYIIYTFG